MFQPVDTCVNSEKLMWLCLQHVFARSLLRVVVKELDFDLAWKAVEPDVHCTVDIVHWDKCMNKQRAVCPAVSYMFRMLDLLVVSLFWEDISYMEQGLSKLPASDKWRNPIRAELLKASYLPPRQSGLLKYRNLSLSHWGGCILNMKRLQGARLRSMNIGCRSVTWAGWLTLCLKSTTLISPQSK